MEIEDIDLDVAHAVLEDSLRVIDDNAEERIEAEPTDSWPDSRPILEWLLSTMPPPADLDDDEDEEFDPVALAQSLIAEQVVAIEDFINSNAAAELGLDPKDETDDALLSLLISLGMSGEDDITEWSPERIEDALARDVPPNVMMDAPIAERFTAVLKGFVSWVLEETGAPEGRDHEGAQACRQARQAVHRDLWLH
ncbi:MAG TPA: hypothetical protein VFY98_09050 [Intrasporangium sp.]|nr:hypothetical protein [Intrasporangium sp.]